MILNNLLEIQSQPEGIFYAHGKIYVVVACCLIILFGLIGYLYYLDKKFSKKK